MKLKLIQKKANYLSFLILLLGIIFISGCVSQNTGGADQNAPSSAAQQAQGPPGKASQGISFSLPAELPIAYVGTPFAYSVDPVGGEPPYEFSYYYYAIAYDGSACGITYADSNCHRNGGSLGIPYGASTTQLTFMPKTNDEGEYMLEVCVSDNTPEHRDNPLCKNATLYIMSDTTTVKGSGKITSSLMWDPQALITVRGKGDTANDTIERPRALVPLSEISSVNLNANLPPKDSDPGNPYSMGSSGGGSIRFEMTANSTSISQSVTGDSPCGTPYKDGTYNPSNQDNFRAKWDTIFGLNISNDGTAAKVVDIFMTGRSAVSSDSKYYTEGGTSIQIHIGHTELRLRAKDEKYINVVTPGNEITDSKVVRVVVEPGSHVLKDIGYILPDFLGGLAEKGCPNHLGTSSGVTVTVADADLSDGKLPTEKIYSWTASNHHYTTITGIK